MTTPGLTSLLAMTPGAPPPGPGLPLWPTLCALVLAVLVLALVFPRTTASRSRRADRSGEVLREHGSSDERRTASGA